PGVLWFNDQYLVNPSSLSIGSNSYRYPCGGAVMAVNQGDPDPRMLLVDAGDRTLPTATRQGGSDHDLVTGVGYGDNRSLVGVNTANPDVYTDTGPSVIQGGAGSDYVESYTITDPNDHTWQIDKYQAYTHDGLTSGTGQTIYNYPVWVVNIMGGRVFIPDDGTTSCQPYVDQVLSQVYGTAPVPPADQVYPEEQSRSLYCSTPTLQGHGSPLDMPARDQPGEPCKTNYVEPAGNSPSGAGVPGDNTSGGYCYDGNVHTAGTNCTDTNLYPVRIYNALLYFHFEDLHTTGVITHDASNTDTNGCQAGTEWACPNGDDNAEGNSHPFNPYGDSSVSPGSGPNTAQACPPAAEGSNPVNHGGSAGSNLCNHSHAVAQIDLYFSPAGRPMPPLNPHPGDATRDSDTQGSSAPFAGTGP